MKIIKRLSLSSKLTLSIISLQIVMLHLTIGYLIFDSIRKNDMSFSGVIPDSQVQIVLDAVGYDDQKKLFLGRTKAVKSILSEPNAWMVVSDNMGQTISLGKVPDVYDRLVNNIDSLGASEIKATENFSQLSMKMLTKTIDKKIVRAMVGGIATYKTIDIFATLAWVISIYIFMPMGIATVVLIPFITRKVLSGISSAVSDAKHINENDLTARIRNQDIPSEIMPLVTAINNALERLSEGYDQRDRFLSSAAHEIRAPIAIIEARLSSIEDPFVRNTLENDVARLSNLAESLLDLQRIGKGLSYFNIINVKDMLIEIISDYSPLIISSGYEVEFIPCVREIFVKGDEAALTRAVINILQNAAIHGGGKGLITVALSDDGHISIQDEGPGIVPAERERIFEPFQRVIPRSQGTGLGLHLVREIVHMHKGRVTVREGKRGGALFEIYLPSIPHSANRQ